MKKEHLRFPALLLSQFFLLGCMTPATYADAEHEETKIHTHEYVLVESYEPDCTERIHGLCLC